MSVEKTFLTLANRPRFGVFIMLFVFGVFTFLLCLLRGAHTFFYFNLDGHQVTEIVPLEEPWVVLVTVSAGFDDMFRNWLYWYQKLNLKMKVFVFAEDKFTFDKYRGVQGMSVWFNASDIGNASAHDWKSRDYKILVSRRPNYLLQLLKLYPNVIYTDIDTVWLKDPRPYFRGDFDFWAQLDGRDICTGFMAFKKSKDTIKILTLWKERLRSGDNVNQQIFNIIMQRKIVKYTTLPTVEFPSGMTFQWKSKKSVNRQHVVVVHNNFIVGKQSKINRFIKCELWKPLQSNFSAPHSP